MRHFRMAWIALIGLALAAFGLVVAPTSAGAVATNEVFAVPASGGFSIQGLGAGHGHGMSQYGALGAANQGRSAAQILAFYYPGTQLGTTGAGSIVVALSIAANDLEVVPASGLGVRDLSTGATSALPAGATRWQLAPVPNSAQTTVNYLDSAAAPHAWQVLAGDAEFVNIAGAPITLVNNGRSYRGSLRSVSRSTSDRMAVNVVSLESYLRGVVPSEMPASWSPAAVQAQAVAARTYALFSKATSGTRGYDICDSAYCQVYAGVGAERAGSDAAISATAGQYLGYNGSPAFTQFSSSDGGWTSAGSQAYLPHQADPYDPATGWTVAGSAAVLQARYPQVGQLTSIGVVSREGGGTWDGRVQGMVLTGSAGQVQISGAAFQSTFGLSSAWFRIVGSQTAAVSAPAAQQPVQTQPATTPPPPPATAPVISHSCHKVTTRTHSASVTRTVCATKVLHPAKAKKAVKSHKSPKVQKSTPARRH